MNNNIPQHKRHLVNTLLQHINNKEILLVTGPRQTGKTTILKQLQTKIEQNYNCNFINLEKMDILADLNQNPLNLLKLIQYQPHQNKKYCVLIDEIQYLKNPTNFLKLIYDEYTPQIKLIVSGSSSFYIDKKFKDSLAGRKKIFEIGTLNFQEFLEFKNEPKLAQLLTIDFNVNQIHAISLLYQKKIEHLFEEFIIFGGYPQIVLAKNQQEKQELLAELANSFVKKDAEESGVENLDNFYKLCRSLAGISSQMLNINKIGKILSINQLTLKRYLYIMKKSFLINEVTPFSNNLLKEITKMPKIFFQDTGLRNHFINNFNSLDTRIDKGELLENCCFKMLKDKLNSDNIQYWRTQDGREVDFIINKKQAFEIKYASTLFNFNKHKQFRQKYPDINLNLITFNEYKDNKQFNTRPAYLI